MWYRTGRRGGAKVKVISVMTFYANGGGSIWACAECLQVARKLVILEGDLERSEERAEVAEA